MPASVDTVRALFDDFNRGDFEAALRWLTEDVDWGPPPDMPEGGGEYRGHDAVVREFSRFMGVWEQLRVGLVDAADVGERVLATTHWDGRSRSGIDVDQHVFQVYELRDGKVARVRQFRTRDEALAAASASAS